VVYRLVVAAYTVSYLLMTIVKSYRPNEKFIIPWPVSLTGWSYLMLTSHLFFSAVAAVIGYFKQSSSAPREPIYRRRALPFYLKLNWFLFAVASPAAFFVTIVYFTAMFPRRRVAYLAERDVHQHIMTSVLVLLELAVSAIPVRILHVVYVVAYGALYLAFSAIYWALDHNRVLYPGVLDWNHPLRTIGVTVVLSVVGFPILQCLLFAAYRLRLHVYDRIYHSQVGLQPANETSQPDPSA